MSKEIQHKPPIPRTDRPPDCVTEVRDGNTVLVVSGFFNQEASATAEDRMKKVLRAEAKEAV